MLLPLDRETLRQEYANASPFPFIKLEPFLDPAFAAEVAAAYPSFEDATAKGRTFKAVNERKKVQVTDARLFPRAAAQLNQALASPSFLSDLSYITGISDLLADGCRDQRGHGKLGTRVCDGHDFPGLLDEGIPGVAAMIDDRLCCERRLSRWCKPPSTTTYLRPRDSLKSSTLV
jgi:hypothetical protein